MIFQEWSCWIFALSANIVTASLHEFSPIFLSGSTQVHGRSPPPSLQHFHNPKTEQAFDFLPFPIFPALPASLSENSLHHWLFLLFTLFLVSLYLPEVSEACLPPSHLGLTTPTEDTRRAAPGPPSAASTPALEILPAPSPGSPKGFHGVNVTTSVARKWEKQNSRMLKLQFGGPLGLLLTIRACFRPIFTLLHDLCIKAVGCAQK